MCYKKWYMNFLFAIIFSCGLFTQYMCVILCLPLFFLRLFSPMHQDCVCSFILTILEIHGHSGNWFFSFSAEERDQCVTLRGNLEQRYKHTEDELATLHVRLEQQIDLKKKNDELEDSVTVCKSELDSLAKLDATKTATLETLRLEKETINTQLDAKRNEYKELQEEVYRVWIFFLIIKLNMIWRKSWDDEMYL